MERTGERQVPSKPGTLEGLDPVHVARYRWASMFTYGKTVYDVASGSGYGCQLLLAKRYCGFDISAEAVDYATQYYGQDNVTFMVADAQSMPSITPADVIVSFETIEHLTDPEAFLGWCAAHTKMLIISSPIRYSYPRSHYHKFEYKLSQFTSVLEHRFTNVTMLNQKLDDGIRYPSRADDHGVAIGVCLQD